MYTSRKPFTAAQYNEHFGPTQMVDWLTACGVRADRDTRDPDGSWVNNDGFPHVRTATRAREEIPFHHWVVPVGDVAVIIPPSVFFEMFAGVPESIPPTPIRPLS